uniref:Pro-thyrotropin-releasing hormone n=1 Tax=Neogobius melanostomus TaxID=47308 RepID=A0A8C6TPW2_9GOBI
MKSTYLLVFASLAVCNLPLCKGQSLTEDDTDHRTIDDIILQKAESLLFAEEEEDIDRDEPYLDVIKRQHPGKREQETQSYLEPQKRQHPGKRTAIGIASDNPLLILSELSKRQHPGKRYLVVHTKRQHPGKLGEDFAELEKRQHPGKRLLDNSSPCSSPQNRLMLEFLDNINTSHVEEKRQHPGKRFALDEDLVEAE